MNAREQGFLLLASSLGDPDNYPLTVAQLRELAQRVRAMQPTGEDRDLTEHDLLSMGYRQTMAQKILTLLERDRLLKGYLAKAKRFGCVPITRVSQEYPAALRRLHLDAPGVLWAKGDLNLLAGPMISLVGSRNVCPENRRFAQKAGRRAAALGYTLVSGNARGADSAAQESCLQAGGRVIAVVADGIADKPARENVLYLSEDSFDLPFSPQRALSRNRVIHCLGQRVLVAQCDHQTGGTWSGTTRNLSCGWTPVYCFNDGSAACEELAQRGAVKISAEELADLSALPILQSNFLDQDTLV